MSFAEATHQELRELFEHSPVGIVQVDLELRFLRCNQAFCKFIGYDEAELLGRSFLEVTHPEDLDASLGAARKMKLIQGESLRLEKRYLHKSGKVIWGELSIRRVADATGRPQRVITVVQDISERKRAEAELKENEERLRLLIDRSPTSMAIVSFDGTIEYFNQKAARTFGYLPEEIPTMVEWFQLAYPDEGYRKKVVAQWYGLIEKALAEHKEIEARDYQVTCKDGSVKTMIISGVPVAERVFVLFDDVTDRKRTEEALFEADRRKTEFLAALSHELRNPLTPIRNSVHLLKKEETANERSRNAVKIIDRQVSHLVALVDDLLDVTRITSGKIRLRNARLELTALLNGILSDNRFLLRGTKLVTQLDGPVWVDGDATRLTQVVENLLTNAAKFTPDGGKITVRLAREGNLAALTVEDTGIGIEPELLSRLFEPFSQGDRSLDRSSGGLGLGLALVKGLVELHHGSVRALSHGVGAGARFEILLPLAPDTAEEADVEKAKPFERLSRRVLVIEDNKDAADTLCSVLELDGHLVAVAYNGPEGVTKAKEFLPEVVLCDIGLPGMDGYEVARALRADQALSKVYLVALTGYAQPEDLRRSLVAGFDTHLAKPPMLEVLERLIAEAPATPAHTAG